MKREYIRKSIDDNKNEMFEETGEKIITMLQKLGADVNIAIDIDGRIGIERRGRGQYF